MKDASTTIGTKLTGLAGRDAIHIAVMSVVAGEMLQPGDNIGLTQTGVATKSVKSLGIVDPFLTEPVYTGEVFWLVLYPRSITSLRHVWEHPYIPNESIDPIPDENKDKSRAWIEDFACDVNMSYDEIMRAAQYWIHTGHHTYENTESYKHLSKDAIPEFWGHYEIVTGKTVDSGRRGSFFTCSC